MLIVVQFPCAPEGSSDKPVAMSLDWQQTLQQKTFQAKSGERSILPTTSETGLHEAKLDSDLFGACSGEFDWDVEHHLFVLSLQVDSFEKFFQNLLKGTLV